MLGFRLRHLIGAALIMGLAANGVRTAVAEDTAPLPTIPEGAQEMAVEGISKLLQALDLFVKSVPQYAAPEVLPNGDIIIRRVHPDQAPASPHPRSDDDGTST